MDFNSIEFLVFFPLVTIIYFSIKHKYRWILLLTASYYFYMSWKPEYIILIIISTLIDYIAGLQIYNSKTTFRRKLFLWLSLIGNFTLLFSFKYFDFFSESVRQVLGLFSIQYSPFMLKIMLPAGISFYTFQTLSYTIDVYRGQLKPEKHFGIFACFVTYFPQLVAGPIERAQNLLHQFIEKHNFNCDEAASGFKLMLWGFFKKIVVADNMAVVVNTIYNNPTDYTGIPLIMATLLFSFQIFCDFSGYSDIAIGSAQVMGFRIMTNFNRPYFSKSIPEFWRRWHISLSTWFRDYLYIPLGGSRVSIPRWYFNIFVVFLISGLWHGANWTFVLWGALHGTFMVISPMTERLRNSLYEKIGLSKYTKIRSVIKILITFALVNLGWVLFRANSIGDAMYIFTHLFSGWTLNYSGVHIGTNLSGIIVIIMSIVILESVHILQGFIRIRDYLSTKPRWVNWSIYMAIIWIILLFGARSSDFIYFQF